MPVRAVARGVEPAHVVARLVRAQLRKLHSAAHARRPVLTRDHAARAAHEGQVEGVDERPGHGTRSLAAGRWGERAGRDAHAGSGRPSWRRSGSGTASSTFSSRSSGLVPSDRPS